MKHERIEINPKIIGGKPVIRGARIPVDMILRELGARLSPQEILAEHPSLRLEDIYAAQAFAADYILMQRTRTFTSPHRGEVGVREANSG